MSNKIFKAGIYARLSREDADRIESNSIQSQRAICLAYIESHDDLELVDTYIDDGETGSNTDWMNTTWFRRFITSVAVIMTMYP